MRLLTVLFFAAVSSGTALAGDDIAVVNPASQYPEGPIVLDGAVYYAEMGSDRVMRFDGKTNGVVWSLAGCGPTSVASAGGGQLFVLCHLKAVVAKIGLDGSTVAIIDRDENGREFVTPNASISDGKGGMYFSSSGTFSPTAPAEGAVMHLDAGGVLKRLAEGIHYSNGVALTPDGKHLYLSEHLSRRVLLYDIAADGSLSGKRTFVSLDDFVPPDPERIWEAGPDGLATDREGNLYIAEYGASRFHIVSPAAKLISTIDLPERFVTAPALSADEKTIYVTAPAATNPFAKGKVYAVANPVKGGG